ncbi:MAG: fumarate reductase subunit FrdD [Gammaproteobacteria bacterium]|nr:fumarate reductase subunit FrdD [Gammaproteobacteria bacterium]
MAKSNKPAIWALFAGGGTLSALVAPMMIFITGIGIPMGWLSADMMSYQRVLAFLQHPLGALVFFIVVFLSLWHAAHRLYVSLHDLGIPKGILPRLICYGGAAVGTLMAIVYLLRVWLF